MTAGHSLQWKSFMVQQVEFNMFHKFHCVCISTAVAASDDNIWLFGLLVTALFTSMKLPFSRPGLVLGWLTIRRYTI